jgi:ribosomal protein S18 acetylase RimI-like enzyme
VSERDHRVRRARESDLPAVRTAVARSWREGYEGVIDPERLAAATADPAEFYPADRFEAKLDDDDLAFLVAVPAGDDDPRGIATVNWGEGNTHGFVPAGESQFRSVYVDPDWWGEGLGTALFEAGREHLPAGVGELWIEVLAGNERGRGFYRRLGFEAVDAREIDLHGERHRTRILRREL